VLFRSIKNSPNANVREAAHEELQRRGDEEKPQKEDKESIVDSLPQKDLDNLVEKYGKVISRGDGSAIDNLPQEELNKLIEQYGKVVKQ
jgi:hypothetical protein